MKAAGALIGLQLRHNMAVDISGNWMNYDRRTDHDGRPGH